MRHYPIPWRLNCAIVTGQLLAALGIFWLASLATVCWQVGAVGHGVCDRRQFDLCLDARSGARHVAAGSILQRPCRLVAGSVFSGCRFTYCDKDTWGTIGATARTMKPLTIISPVRTPSGNGSNCMAF